MLQSTAYSVCVACTGTYAVLDHGSHIFVWLPEMAPTPSPHARAQAQAHHACCAFADSLTAGRFPVPEILTIVEVL
jgi:hypothetical protein